MHKMRNCSAVFVGIWNYGMPMRSLPVPGSVSPMNQTSIRPLCHPACIKLHENVIKIFTAEKIQHYSQNDFPSDWQISTFTS